MMPEYTTLRRQEGIVKTARMLKYQGPRNGIMTAARK